MPSVEKRVIVREEHRIAMYNLGKLVADLHKQNDKLAKRIEEMAEFPKTRAVEF
jgi:hypothetical protein